MNRFPVSKEERKGVPGEKNMEKWRLVSEGVSRNCGSLIWVQSKVWTY